jgi:hypothetical protein
VQVTEKKYLPGDIEAFIKARWAYRAHDTPDTPGGRH